LFHLLQASLGNATAAPSALEKEEISSSLPSPVKMPRSGSGAGAGAGSPDVFEYDSSDFTYLPSVGDGSDDLPLP